MEEKTGHSPSYVTGDNASTTVRAVRDGEYEHVPDAGHTFGLFLQRVYGKDGEFAAFMEEVNGVKFRKIMCPVAYPPPPEQRAVARFMNISHTVKRAAAMLNSYDRPGDEERSVFHFIPENASLTGEMETVARTVDHILKLLKREGLPKKSAVRVCRK